MKEIKKKIGKILLSLTMVFAMALTIMPTNVFAANTAEIWVNGENIITASNNTVQCGDGTAVYDSNLKTLTLTNATLTTANIESRTIDIGSNLPITISLIGENVINSGVNTPIYSNSDITFSGTGSLTTNSTTAWGIASNGNIIVDGVTIHTTVTAEGGFFSENMITIQNNATVVSKGHYYGFQATNGMNISHSTVTAEATENNCNGIYVLNGSLSIKDNATLNATSKYPALWAKTGISIEDSAITATSTTDMGIWTPATLSISGDTTVTAIGATGSLGGGTSTTITPSVNKSVDIFIGNTQSDATLLDGSPFSAETDLKTLNVGSSLYFQSRTHTHTPATEWSKDDTNHWHDCTAGDGEKMELAFHTFGEWVVDTEATETTKGSKHRDCTVCGQSETVDIPALDTTPEKPTITAGAGSTHQISDGEDMTFTCSGKLEDLTGVYVDGKLVDDSNYTLKSGSTILTLKANYLNTLSTGMHTLKFQYKDNVSAETSFTITVKEPTVTPTETNKTATTPKTGDSSALPAVLALVAVSGLTLGALKLRKRSK